MIHQYPYHVCMQYMNRYVKLHTVDGKVFEGIIVNVDEHNVTLAIPEGREQPVVAADNRPVFGPFGGFFPGFRFFPFAFPFASLGGIFPFTFFI